MVNYYFEFYCASLCLTLKCCLSVAIEIADYLIPLLLRNANIQRCVGRQGQVQLPLFPLLHGNQARPKRAPGLILAAEENASIHSGTCIFFSFFLFFFLTCYHEGIGSEIIRHLHKSMCFLKHTQTNCTLYSLLFCLQTCYT